MAGTNSTVCTEDCNYFQSNCDTTTALPLSNTLVTTGLSKTNNLTYFNYYYYPETKIDTRNKFRRIKRSKNTLINEEVNYGWKPLDFSEGRNDISKRNYIAKKNEADYNNIMYDWNYEKMQNIDTGEYYIDEPQYLVEGKYLSTLIQNDTLYFSKPIRRYKTESISNNPQKFVTKEVMQEAELIANEIKQQKEASSKNLPTKNPKRRHVSKANIKFNVLKHTNNDKNLFKLSSEKKLMDEAQYYIDNNYILTPKYANIQKSLVKQKCERGVDKKYLLADYESEDTLMSDDTSIESFDENLFMHKPIASSIVKQRHTRFARPGIRKEETNFCRKFETKMITDTRPHEIPLRGKKGKYKKTLKTDDGNFTNQAQCTVY